MASILFLVNHPEAYINHRNYFEEKGFEVTMRHIWRYDYQHYDHVLCDEFISGGSYHDIKKAYPQAILIKKCPSIRKAILGELPSTSNKPLEKPKKVENKVLDMSKYFVDQSYVEVEKLINLFCPKIKNVLITGETGTGKEHIARYIHDIKKTPGNFIPVDCGSLNDELIASEFYGHIKGAFTGAYQDKEGYFEKAHGGTLFLDEIENLSIKGQVALLRALQELTFIKVGDNRIQKVDFNLVCTTNVELWDLISKGGFRSDLYYRISHVRFNVPPVRDYYNIPGLIEFLIDQVCEEYNLTPYIDKHDLVIETMQKLHPYKGNIREIKSYLTTELIKLDASRSSTLTGIELMKTTPL